MQFSSAYGSSLILLHPIQVIERLSDMACILAMLSVDLPVADISHWCKALCTSVKESLERSQINKGAAMEAYAVLSIFIKL